MAEKNAKPMVGIVMGSKNDYSVMKEAEAILDKLKIPYKTRILSAHRTPDEAKAFADSLRENGYKVLIAGAGRAAHLAGAMAAATTLPVIGVPICSGALNGVDALYATVQMPNGIPVATVAIDGAANAGILAAQIIGSHDTEVANRLNQHRKEMREKVLAAKFD